MSLNPENYTLLNALTWGNFSKHCQEARQGSWESRAVHVIIATTEFLPVISQIVSLVELVLAKLNMYVNSYYSNTSFSEELRTEFLEERREEEQVIRPPVDRRVEEVTALVLPSNPLRDSRADANLIKFFLKIPHVFKPILEGSEVEKADAIRTWMRKKRISKLELGMSGLAMLPPEISLFYNLQQLYLDHNQITSLEGVTFPSSLQTLNLRYNQLTSLSDSILNLSRNCGVYAEGNLFSRLYVEEFQERLNRQRAEDPIRGPRVDMSIFEEVQSSNAGAQPQQSLEAQIRTWLAEFTAGASSQEEHSIECFRPLLDLEDDTKKTLKDYLIKLRETADYQNEEARPNIILRVKNILQLACENEDFRDVMLAAITDGLHTCRDRPIIIFNDIEVQWHIHREELSDKDAAALAIRIQRYEALKEYAKAEVESRGLVDEIETMLYFCIKLRDALDLPITTKGMHYARCSGVTDEMLGLALSKIASIADNDLLAGSEFWLSRVEKQQPEGVAQITEEYMDILEAAGEYYRIECEEMRQSFLGEDKNEKLKIILQNPAINIIHYDEAAKEIDKQRRLEISKLLVVDE